MEYRVQQQGIDMWHLKTRLGTFWVVETSNDNDNNSTNNYFLGINDQELGAYDDVSRAVKDVHEQSTGYLQWDCLSHIKAPGDISEWDRGEPADWGNS